MTGGVCYIKGVSQEFLRQNSVDNSLASLKEVNQASLAGWCSDSVNQASRRPQDSPRGGGLLVATHGRLQKDGSGGTALANGGPTPTRLFHYIII